MSDFDDAVAMTPTLTPELFIADLPPSWRVHRGPINGGLTVSAAVKGLLERVETELGHPDPICVSAFYLAAADPGPAEIHTEIIRSGRSMSTGQANVVQAGADGEPKERLRALATFADLGTSAPEAVGIARPPYLPPQDECIHIDDLPGYPRDEVEVMQHYDMLIDPDTTGGPDGRPSGLGQLRAWFRMRDGRDPDTLLLPLVVDAFPPIAWDLGVSGWVPTLELTVHVRARPAPGWLRVEITSTNLAGGFVEEDSEVWDSADRMVAQARQLAKVIHAPTSLPVGHGWVV
ncbi:MAG: TesB-like acyl-CoA thioesterase 3 [Actinomycetales bacterium]|nr:MAG: TesB-like acyl-CoA thioesterase 3 [Actinomycetales bacterium]